MEHPPLAISGTRILSGGKIRPATILIRHGIVESLESREFRPGVEFQRLDAGDRVVMSGLIDPHVHLNQPGRTHWEGVESGTKAAAAGGVTLLVDMPLNCSPVTVSLKNLRIKEDSVRGRLHTNCGFWGGLTPSSLPALPGLLTSGVFGVKVFLTHSGLDEFPQVERQHLEKAMPLIAASGLPLLVHAELESCLPVSCTDPRTYQAFLRSRPDEWEYTAVEMMASLAEQFQCRVHIVHLSSSTALPLVREAKKKGVPLSAETCPHYLWFHSEEIPDGETNFKCTPPIRDARNQDALWNALGEGLIDFVCSDHSPCLPSMKHSDSGDFHTAWGGISSLSLSLPVLWHKLKSRGEDGMLKIWEWLSRNPAKFLNLATRKGDLQKGMDADIVIWEPEEQFTVTKESLLFRHKISPYLGQDLSGKVHTTILQGKIIYQNGEAVNGLSGRLLHANIN